VPVAAWLGPGAVVVVGPDAGEFEPLDAQPAANAAISNAQSNLVSLTMLLSRDAATA
jgi:hypothetical protein